MLSSNANDQLTWDRMVAFKLIERTEQNEQTIIRGGNV